MNNIYKTLLVLWALTLSAFAQTGDNTKILYQFKDALWNQTATTAKDSGSPGGKDATVEGNGVTFVNNGVGGTAIQYSITSTDAKLTGLTAGWGERFVLEARIKKSALDGADSEIHILKNVVTTGLDWYIDTDNKMVLKVGDGSSINIISDTPVIGTDAWITLAAVVDLTKTDINEAVKFFINEGEVSTGGPSAPAKINQVVFDETFTARNFNTDPLVIDNLQGDSFDYTVVINYLSQSTGSELRLYLNDDQTSNYRTYWMRAYNSSPAAYISDSNAMLEFLYTADTTIPSLGIYSVTGESGNERIIDGISASTILTSTSTVKKDRFYWKNTTDEISNIVLKSMTSNLASTHVRVFSTPKAASTDNWELVDSGQINQTISTTSSFDIENLDLDEDEEYRMVIENGSLSSGVLYLRLNDDNGSNYSNQRLWNNSGSIASVPNTPLDSIYFWADNNVGDLDFTIKGDSSQSRIINWTGSKKSVVRQVEGTGWWNNSTDNLTSLNFYSNGSATFQGNFRLYKKKDPAGVADKYNLPFEVVETVDINGDFSAGHTFSNLTGDSEFMYKLEFVGNIPTGTPQFRVQLNDDSTTSNYNLQYLRGTNSSAIASTSVGDFTWCWGNKASTFETYIYPKSGSSRVSLSTNGYAENYLELTAGWWSNSIDEIISLKVFASTASSITGKLVLSKIPLSVSQSSGQQQASSNTSGTYQGEQYDSIPNLTADSDQGYTISTTAGPYTTYNVFKILDGKVGNTFSRYYSESFVSGTEIIIDLPEAKKFSSVNIHALTSNNYGGIGEHEWYGSNDGVDWTLLASATKPNSDEIYKVNFSVINSFSSYKLKVNSTYYSSRIEIEELYFFESEERSTVLSSVDTSSSFIPDLSSNTDQGYIVSASDEDNPAYMAIDASSTYGWWHAPSTDAWWKVIFDTPKNVSALNVKESYSVTYPDYHFPETVTWKLILEDDSEVTVYDGPWHGKKTLVSWHFEGNAKGIVAYTSAPNDTVGHGFGGVEFYSGTYSPGQPQTPFQSVQIPQNEGTAIGDLTGNGGLAASFNSSLHETYIAASSKSTQTDASVGKDWGLGNEKTIGKLIMYGPNNQGFFNQHGNATYSFQISDDGTTWETVHVITEAHNNVGNLVKEVNIPSPVKSRFFRVHLSNTLTAFPYMSELEFFEAKALDGGEYVPLTDVAGYSSSQISQGFGLSIGNNGYLSSMFNGVVEAGSSSSGGHTIGKDWGGDKRLGQIKFYGPTNRGIYTNVGDLIVLVEGWNGTTWEEITTKTFVGECSTSNFVGEITDLDSSNSQHRITITSSFGDSSMFMSEVEFYELTPYFGFPSSGAISVGQVALAASSTYTSGIYPTISGENAIEMLSKTGAFAVESDFIKMTLKRPDVEFDVANFQKSEGYKVDSNYNLTGTTSSSIYIYPPKLLRRVNNPPTDFDNLGLPKEGVAVDIDNGTGGKVFYGVFQFEFALSQAISENVTVDVFMKTGDFDFKKVAEIKPTPKPANPETPWVIRHYWNARSTQFDWDGNAYKTTGAVQFKLEVR